MSISKNSRTIALRAGAIGAAAGVVAALGVMSMTAEAQQAPRLLAPPVAADGTLSFADLVERVRPAVVSVLVEREVERPQLPSQLEEFFRFRFGDPDDFFGSPFEDGTEMGPLTTQPQFERVKQVLKEAEADGLKPLTGGKARGGDGFFIEPTVYLDVPDDHAIWRREIFGPVLAMRGFADEGDAVRLANDTDYWLVATLVSPDKARTDRVAAALEAGMVWVNSQQVIFPQTSWGGFKASGIGRELGPWGLSAFTGVKHIIETV